MIRGRNSRLGGNGHIVRRAAALCATFTCLAAALAATPPAAFAAEEETHVFDATLSLTGNCEASKKDPVPDPSCPEEAPDGAFTEPFGATTDSYGDIFYFGRPTQGSPIDIYVFDASGHFVTEVPNSAVVGEARALAVDGEGNLYAVSYNSSNYRTELYVLRPSAYDPEASEIVYGNAPSVVPLGSFSPKSLAVERSTDRVFAVLNESGGGLHNRIGEIGSYAEGNTLLRTFGTELFQKNSNLAVDAKTNRIYVSEKLPSEDGAYPSGIKVLDFEGNLLETMTGIETVSGFHEFIAPFGELGVAVDESTGHLFVSDFQNNPKPAVYEVNAAGEPVSTITHSFEPTNNDGAIAIDNGIHSPNSSMDPESPISEEENSHGSYLFVPSGVQGTGHLYAFEPKPIPKPPLIVEESFTGVSNTEAVLAAKVNPNGLPTNYRFEYLSAANFEKNVEEAGAGHGFDNATSLARTLAAGNEAVSVSLPLDSLQPGTAYRFRLVASSACEGEAAPACESEGEALSFSTYAELTLAPGPCPNQGLRTGPSAALPDCRAFELVTPANTNGHAPRAPTNNGAGPKFGTPPASATGEAVGFLTLGGAIPGYDGTGAFNGDAYVATRTPAGWQTESAGPSGDLSTNPNPGGFSPDLRYVAWYIGPLDFGTLAVAAATNYIHYPDGSEHLVGEGSVGTDLRAEPLMISAGATHIIFSTAHSASEEPQQLEPDAPPNGTVAIYDRTADGILHVVSLLPHDVTPAAGENARYEGASAQGNAVAFKVGTGASPLYVRLDDAETLEAAGGGATFAGLPADGRYLFYLSGGDLFRYDTQAKAATQISSGHDATVVNVPSEGTSAYFTSPSVQPEAGKNPNGAEAVAGEANLYYWDGSAIHFVATLTKRDIEGGGGRGALGQWTASLSDGSTAVDPSRTTPGGSAIVFESNANLTGYDSGGAAEIYHYDAAEGTLACLSCDPTQAPATGDARLQTVNGSGGGFPTNSYSQVPSLSANGKRVFFESPDALVPADTDGVRDVYEWEADGEGTCATAGGCVFLISSGQSAHDNYLYGVSESGRDVFVYTTDLLTSEDGDETPSVYDARVDGGFPPPASRAAECLGEACQPAAVAPNDPTPASSSFEGAGNAKPQGAGRRCPKGSRKVRKGKQARCIPRRHKHSHRGKKTQGRAGSKRRAAR